jgi:hypothetical protein
MTYIIEFSLEREISETTIDNFLDDIKYNKFHENNRKMALRVIAFQMFKEQLDKGEIQAKDFNLTEKQKGE